MTPTPPERDDNAQIAARLREMAELLEAQGGNPYRAMAYRSAADTLDRLETSARDIFHREGVAALDALPAIGPGISAAVAEMLSTGQWRQLERQRSAADPLALLRTVPGVGAGLARRLHESLGAETLEDLEAAAHDGRLADVPRLGARRAAAIGATLTQMLDQRRSAGRGQSAATALHEPPVEWLLDIDRAYREAAQADTLPKIAPRRFNPEHKAWLPVMHRQRGDWRFTALYSNTARAHDLDRVHDWVVIYCENTDHGERRYTVVTDARGSLAGQRVVRGREPACRAWYAAH